MSCKNVNRGLNVSPVMVYLYSDVVECRTLSPADRV